MSFKIFLDKLTSNKSKLDTIDLNDYKEDLTQNDYMDILEFISKFRSRFIKFNEKKPNKCLQSRIFRRKFINEY